MKENTRHVPFDAEAEASVLGSILLDNTSWDDVSSVVRLEDFYREPHRYIWKAMEELVAAGQPIDVVTLATQLRARDRLEKVGGGAYLANLSNNTPASLNVAHYAQIVRSKSIVRQIIATAQRIVEVGMEDPEDIQDFVSRAQSSLIQVSESASRGSTVGMRAGIKDWYLDLEQRMESGDSSGLSTGLSDLDRIINGLQDGKLYICAGRPSMGKSALAGNIAYHVGQKARIPVHIFTLEMPVKEYVGRMVVLDAKRGHSAVTIGGIEKGRLNDNEMAMVVRTVGELSEAPIFIDDTSGLTVNELCSRARQVWRQHGTRLIIVDYLQLLGSVQSRNKTRDQEVGEMSRALKGLAKDLGLPVIAVSQLNRDVERRTNKRPLMADLRESGSIEQDADVVIFLYRDAYYNKQTDKPGVAEAIIAKQRNGPTGTVEMLFVGPRAEFRDLVKHDYGYPG